MLTGAQKKVFAEYWDEVTDVKDISGVSRFMSGGVAGITSQLCGLSLDC
jgi:solute carrier family 25 phosphate transporter 23/24/25/41